MNSRLRHILLTFLTLTALSAPTFMKAQEVESYKFDVGAGLGFSGYLGDTNGSNLFNHMGLAVNAEGRYLFNERWSLRGQFTYAGISGNSADFENVFPGGEQYEFKSNVYDFGVRGEVNFFNYGLGKGYKRLRRWTPFLSLGVGVSVAACEGKATAGLSIPMGLGVRFKVRPRLNLHAEFSMTKVFSDKMDSVKDPQQIASSFLKNTDWYSTFMIGFSYEFGPRCVVCNRID